MVVWTGTTVVAVVSQGHGALVMVDTAVVVFQLLVQLEVQEGQVEVVQLDVVQAGLVVGTTGAGQAPSPPWPGALGCTYDIVMVGRAESGSVGIVHNWAYYNNTEAQLWATRTQVGLWEETWTRTSRNLDFSR